MSFGRTRKVDSKLYTRSRLHPKENEKSLSVRLVSCLCDLCTIYLGLGNVDAGFGKADLSLPEASPASFSTFKGSNPP